MEFPLFFLTSHGSTASVEGITYLKPTAKGPEKRAVDSDDFWGPGANCECGGGDNPHQSTDGSVYFWWFGGESEASHFWWGFFSQQNTDPKTKLVTPPAKEERIFGVEGPRLFNLSIFSYSLFLLISSSMSIDIVDIASVMT